MQKKYLTNLVIQDKNSKPTRNRQEFPQLDEEHLKSLHET